MINKNMNFAAAVALLGAAVVAHAQYVRPAYSFPSAPVAGGPANVQVADTPLYVTPVLGGAFGHDDNLLQSHTNERASNLYVVSPGITVDARDANKVIYLNYNAQIGRYTSSREDDYVDQTARGQFDMAIDAHNYLRLGFDYIRGHDARGSTDRPLQDQPDRYRQSNPYAMYALGAPGARGRVELYYNDASRVYLNNRDVTNASDRDTQEYGGAFYWRVMPKTYVMAEARETNIRYDLPSVPLSADEHRYYAGVTWEATAATTGTLKYGQLKREFKNDTQPDFSGPSWEGLITWAPRTYTKFDFYTARQTNESTGLGSFILTSIYGATWTHNWTSYVTTGVDARFTKDDYQGFDRNDKTAILGLKAGYKFRRWLTFGAEYTYTKRDSSIDSFDYNRNLFLITATASM